MTSKYINAVDFRDFKKNQDTLISVLNHNITKLTIDVKWIKWLTCGLVIALIGTAISIIISGYL